MSESPFLDPFAVPTSGEHGPPGPDAGDSTGDVVPGTVVNSGPASAEATHALNASIPLDLDQAVGAFVDDTHLWWPRGLRATGEAGHVYFGDGALLEEDADGPAGDQNPPYEWAVLAGAAEGALELDWWGGHREAADSPVRLYLSWSGGPRGGAELSVRGSEPTSWLEEWTAVLGAFTRYAGGSLAEPGEGREGA
ncbi:hypothetical protein [Citricoccus alkalitolerans]|uniref:Activator of Hsp90 ATPase homolog 1-like protein n=1 Tax=Citricoccus alkalitolerans TaxID=246603 RepID=A0ABV8Y216_9MICC